MLSEHERRQLTEIAYDLEYHDPGLTAALRTGRYPPRRRWRQWLAWLAVAVGLLAMILGIVAGTISLFFEGAIFLVAGAGYTRWQRRRRSADRGRPVAGGRRKDPDSRPPESPSPT